MTERFLVYYRITVDGSIPVEQLARDICVEQTVEIPYEYISEEHIREQFTGNVEKITPAEENVYDVCISYRSDLVTNSVSQLLNVLYGNISLKKGIRVTSLELSNSLNSVFKGPSAGITGIRKMLGVFNRPLACTALKPVGLSSAELAKLAGLFSAGGIDLIKDDHGINVQHFHPFKERVAMCQEAVETANQKTGRISLYFPGISGSPDQMEEQIDFAVRLGIRGVLIAPLLCGPDTVSYFAEKYGIIILAHPSLCGTFTQDPSHGIAPEVLFGTIFRIAGSDISIFPGWGGRFPVTREECIDIAKQLRSESVHKKAFPCIAGGMNPGRIKDYAEALGEDAVYLIGGALLDPAKNTQDEARKFMDSIREHFDEKLRAPENFASSCEISLPGDEMTSGGVLPCIDYRWNKRPVTAYKADKRLPFKGISRAELYGRYGEKTGFDLRYFEIEPGGFSSFEKHLHEHVIIGVRGKGVLSINGEKHTINPLDIGYVEPMQPHQLLNEKEEPFGFFCIVDHERDKPAPCE